MIMHERLGGEGARIEAQKTCAAAGFRRLVDIACENLLLDAGG